MFLYYLFANFFFIVDNFQRVRIALVVVLAGVIVYSIIYCLMRNIIKRKALALAQARDGDGTSNRSLSDELNEFSANFPGLFTVEPYFTEGKLLGYQILSN